MSSTPTLTIVHVVFSSRIAGGERHCLDLAAAQAANGHRVHIVGPSRSAIREAIAPGVRYHGMALPLLRGRRLQRIARGLGADVCHAHLGPACKAAATLPEGARIGTLHVGYKPHQHGQLDGVVCVNRQQRGQLNSYGGESCVIHNWAPAPAPAQGNLRSTLGLRPEQLLVASVGRLHSTKGMDVLIRAFKAEAPADAVLLILGEGPQRAELERIADGDTRIHLPGFRSDVDACLQEADLFVSSSREEAFPLAVLEAMRAGLPIIATETQGPREMLQGQPARFVPIADAQALGRALGETLVGLRHQRQRVSYDMRAYDRSQAVEQVETFYRDVIAVRAREAVGAALAYA
ncbi:MAG: glycosyltransferase [Paucibacter sp.]|nr:glycosyltransferase [Roseateles sp.]